MPCSAGAPGTGSTFGNGGKVTGRPTQHATARIQFRPGGKAHGTVRQRIGIAIQRLDLQLQALAFGHCLVADGKQQRRGVIGAGTAIRGVKTMLNVTVGPGAKIEGAAVLENGTILSEAKAPVTVGSGVVARDFIIAEGSSVTDGALLANTYVGQGCKIGKQFSAENCLPILVPWPT